MTAHPVERLSAFMDGELPPAEHADVAAHLRACAECARQVQDLAAVDAMARELPIAAPAGYFDALPGRVRARIRRAPRLSRILLWGGMAAAAVLAIAIAPATLERATAPAATPPPPAAPAARPATTVAPARAPASPAFASPAAADASGREVDRVMRDARARLDERGGGAESKVSPKAAPRPAAALQPRAPAGGHESPASLRDQQSSEEMRQAAEKRGTIPPEPAKKAEDVAALAGAAPAPQPQTAAPPPAAGVRRERNLSVTGRVLAEPAGGANAEQRFRALEERRPASAKEARDLREAWDAYAREQPADAHADEARVRVIEAGILAWRLGGDPADLARARADGRVYLAGTPAPQRKRVRAALAALPPSGR